MFKFKKKDENEQIDNNESTSINEDFDVSNDDFNPEDDIEEDYNKTKITRDDLFSATKKEKPLEDNYYNQEEDNSYNQVDDNNFVSDNDNDDINNVDEDEIIEDKNDNDEVEVKEEKSKREIKKEIRKENTKSNVDPEFKLGQFIIKIFASVLLTSLSIVLYVFAFTNKTYEATFVLLYSISGTTLIVSLVTMFSIINSEFPKSSKRFIMIVGLIELLYAIFMGVCGFVYMYDKEAWFSVNVVEPYYLYYLSDILYTVAILYLWKTCIHKAKASHYMFWLNIFFITVACFLCAIKNTTDNQKNIHITLGSIALATAAITVIISIVEYHIYDVKVNGKKPKKEKKTNNKENNDNKTLDETNQEQ